MYSFRSSLSLVSNNISLQKANGDITLDSRSEVDLDVQIQLNLDLEAGVSVFLLLAVFTCLGVRGAALAQCVAWVAVEWVATSGQWLLCDIGCVLSTAICSK